MINWIESLATKRNILIFLMVLLIMMLGIMPYCANLLEKYASGQTVIDLLPLGYSTQDMLEVLRNFGKEGRATYLKVALIADSIYPLSYTLFYTTCIAWLLGKVQVTLSWTWLLISVPIIGGLFDFFENFGMAYAIHTFPVILGWSRLTPVFSAIKWICVSLAMLILIILGVSWVIKAYK